MNPLSLSRRLTDRLMRAAAAGALLLALIPLASLLAYVVQRGASSLSWSFLTELPKPVGEPHSGIGNAIVGTVELVALGGLFGVPVGILGGLYVAEFARGRLARVVRFSADTLGGIPSIAVGIFVYTVVVRSMGGFSTLAGALALGILMIPTVVRTTEEILRLVPASLRESALALGIPRWRVSLRVILRAGVPGITTGVMLAIARAAGETAPLLFTAFGNQYWSSRLDQPIASLPLQIYTYAISPYDEWHAQAFAGALVLVGLILILNLAARLLTRAPQESDR